MQPMRIGRYRVQATLGRGAMGVVYSARDDQMGRDVAVKMMTSVLETDEDARTRFFREAQLTGKLLHRNVVTVLDLGEEDGHPFIVMELLKGSTLTRALAEPRLGGLEPKMDLMIQTCEGLARAHAAGVVHRDIKPSNLFVLPDGGLKILDFGVARLADSSMTRSGLVIGTPDYMSPEQAQGEEVDARSDVFSAAAVFYLMVTGRRPFEAPDVPSILRKVVNDDPVPIAVHEAPAPLARTILRGLRKNPASRYQNCVDLGNDIARIKRHYDAETRQMRTDLRADFERALVLSEGLARLRAQAGLPPATAGFQDAAAIKARFPYFVSGPSDSGQLPLLRRDRMIAIGAEIRAIRDAVVGQLEQLAVDAASPRLRPDGDGHSAERRAEAIDALTLVKDKDKDATAEPSAAASLSAPEPRGQSVLAKWASAFGRRQPR